MLLHYFLYWNHKGFFKSHFKMFLVNNFNTFFFWHLSIIEKYTSKNSWFFCVNSKFIDNFEDWKKGFYTKKWTLYCYCTVTKELLTFHIGWIRKQSELLSEKYIVWYDINWLSRSCDLPSFDYFLWGFFWEVKSLSIRHQQMNTWKTAL